MHNLVNERLEKPEFDCLTLDATYDCGCGDDEKVDGSGDKSNSSEDGLTGVKIVKGG